MPPQHAGCRRSKIGGWSLPQSLPGAAKSRDKARRQGRNGIVPACTPVSAPVQHLAGRGSAAHGPAAAHRAGRRRSVARPVAPGQQCSRGRHGAMQPCPGGMQMVRRDLYRGPGRQHAGHILPARATAHSQQRHPRPGGRPPLLLGMALGRAAASWARCRSRARRMQTGCPSCGLNMAAGCSCTTRSGLCSLPHLPRCLAMHVRCQVCRHSTACAMPAVVDTVTGRQDTGRVRTASCQCTCGRPTT